MLRTIERILGRRAVETGAVTNFQNPAAWLLDMGDTLSTTSGVTVSVTTAHQIAAVHACVRIIAQTLAGCPLHLYRRILAGSSRKQRDDEHMVSRLLREPNGEMTAFEFWECMVAHLELRGNAYAEIERNGYEEPIGLWPLHPDRMLVGRIAGEVAYEYRRPDRERAVLGARDVLHLRYMTLNGLTGLSPIEQCRNSLGLAIASHQHSAEFFAHNATPPSLLMAPTKLKDEDALTLLQRVNARHQGPGKQWNVGLVDNGVKWETLGIKNTDAQLLEIMKFTIRDVARIFGVQPHKIGDLEQASFSNIEHQAIEFIQDTVLPRARRIEQALNRALLEPEERSSYFVEFLLDNLVRADIKARHEAYQSGINAGWMTRNEVRDLENRNPLDGLDEPLVAVNMAGAGSVARQAAVEGEAGTRDRCEPADFRHDGRGTVPRFREDAKRGQFLGWDGNSRRSEQTERDSPSFREDAKRGQSLGERGASERRRIREAHRGAVRAGAARAIAGQVSRVKAVLERAWGPAPEKANRTERSDRTDRTVVATRGDVDVEVALEELFEGDEVAGLVEEELGTAYRALLTELGIAAAGEAGAAVPAGLSEFITETVRGWCKHHRGINHTELRSILSEHGAAGVYKRMLERMEQWESTLPDVIAGRAVTQSDGTIAREIWRRLGVTKIRWAAGPGACPMCRNLDGKTVGIESEEAFVPKGTDAAAGIEGVSSLWAGADVLHPPLHQGCACSIVRG